MILIKIKHLLFASGNMLLLWVFYNFTFFMLVACSHREQVYSLETEIMISADWSRSGLNEKEQDYGATTVFYPTDGSSPIMVLMGDRTYKTVYLKEGRYDVVLFNRSFDDFGNLGFRGEDAYRTLEAHATNVVTKDVPPYTVAGGIPAKPIKKRYPEETIAALSELKWWDWPEERIAQNLHAIQAGKLNELR